MTLRVRMGVLGNRLDIERPGGYAHPEGRGRLDIAPRSYFNESSSVNAVRPITDQMITRLRTQEVSKIQNITLDEEKRLYDAIQNGSADEQHTARNRLIEGHIKATIARAGKASTRNLEYNEKVAIGLLALVEAGHQFEPKRGNKFMSLDDKYIKTAIRETDKLPKEIPFSTIEAIISKKFGKEVRLDDILDSTGKIHLGKTHPSVDLPAPRTVIVKNAAGFPHPTTVASINKSTTTSGERKDLEQQAQTKLSDAVQRLVEDKLTERQQQVIKPLYGIGEEQQDIAVIAKRLNLTTQTVGQYRDEVLRKLRKDIRAWQIMQQYFATNRIAELGTCRICGNEQVAMSKRYGDVCMSCVLTGSHLARLQKVKIA